MSKQSKEEAKSALIDLYEGQIPDLTMMSKIELGNLIAEIKQLKEIINERLPSDIKFGLMVVDPNQEGDTLDVLHVVGYFEEPTQIDVDQLREELSKDKRFGLTKLMDQLEILPAPQYIVDQLIKDIEENEN